MADSGTVNGSPALRRRDDRVTGLPGRDALERHLAALDEPVSLVAIDIDHFSAVNDSLGRSTGDQLLGAIAARLTASAPAGSFVARTGGNVFSVVAGGPHADDATARDLAGRLLSTLSEPFEVTGRTLRVSASAGVALPLGAATGLLLVDDLHRRADLALSEAKSGARGQYAVWEPQLSLRSAQRLDAQQDLRAALARPDGLEVHYQPVVDVRTRARTGVECLVRRAGQDPASGAGAILAAAAETHLLAALDRRVLELAGADLPAWRGDPADADGGGVRVHVNVTADGLSDARWLASMQAVSAASGPRMCVEVTEHALVATGTAGAAHLEDLRGAGHLVALDDFGAGYTSLATIANLPADILKLDRSLLFDVATDRRRRAVLAGALTLGKDLGLIVVAEGVETEEQHDVLIELGCDEAQGWLHGRPEPLLR